MLNMIVLGDKAFGGADVLRVDYLVKKDLGEIWIACLWRWGEKVALCP